ncbi:MAG: hypothetical protein HGB37_03695 [Candidatus Moranbacteria bacterium]|nr:hypothetical protein [Candidatus Moranbacteria bacterium]NTW89980.1 hypothetical protein [Candidatus Moranbacteria bacterium]
MIVNRTWCLPPLDERALNDLHNSIVKAVVSTPSSGVQSERDMLNLFPSDMMSYGLGDEVYVEIMHLPERMQPFERRMLGDLVRTAVCDALERSGKTRPNVQLFISATHPDDIVM